MDTTVQRLLNDKLYDKRKQGALESALPLRSGLATRLIFNQQLGADCQRSDHSPRV